MGRVEHDQGLGKRVGRHDRAVYPRHDQRGRSGTGRHEVGTQGQPNLVGGSERVNGKGGRGVTSPRRRRDPDIS